MFWLFLGVFIFRWHLFERFLGTKRMFLLDTLAFTILAAINFANPGASAWLGYGLGGLCVFFTYLNAKRWLKYDELMKAANDEQGKSNGGTTPSN